MYIFLLLRLVPYFTVLHNELGLRYIDDRLEGSKPFVRIRTGAGSGAGSAPYGGRGETHRSNKEEREKNLNPDDVSRTCIRTKIKRRSESKHLGSTAQVTGKARNILIMSDMTLHHCFKLIAQCSVPHTSLKEISFFTTTYILYIKLSGCWD